MTSINTIVMRLKYANRCSYCQNKSKISIHSVFIHFQVSIQLIKNLNRFISIAIEDQTYQYWFMHFLFGTITQHIRKTIVSRRFQLHFDDEHRHAAKGRVGIRKMCSIEISNAPIIIRPTISIKNDFISDGFDSDKLIENNDS